MKFLILFPLFCAIVVAGIFISIEDDTERLNPAALLRPNCDYLSPETLNSVFDERIPNRFSSATAKDHWEFNSPGIWRENSLSCIWISSNVVGLSVVISAREFQQGEKFDDGTSLPPFVTTIDEFGDIGERLMCFGAADKAAVLRTSNYGEGGIAMTWNQYSIHVHVIADREEEVQVRVDTELEAEWLLSGEMLGRLEAYKRVNRTLIVASREKDNCS